jgi:hypothetical protein
MNARSNILRLAILGLLVTRAPRPVRRVLAFAILGVLLTVVLLALGLAARSEPQQQVVDITEMPQGVRGRWCIETEFPTGGTRYKPCGEKPDVSISAKLIVPRSGAGCAFSQGMVAGPQPLYLIEIACPPNSRYVYWMVRDNNDNNLLIIKPANRGDIPSGGKQ